jgi:hypothetical protein
VTHMRHKRQPVPAVPQRPRDTADETGVTPGHRSATGTPRWVLVLGIVVAVGLALLLLVLHLTGVLGPGAH